MSIAYVIESIFPSHWGSGWTCYQDILSVIDGQGCWELQSECQGWSGTKATLVTTSVMRNSARLQFFDLKDHICMRCRECPRTTCFDDTMHVNVLFIHVLYLKPTSYFPRSGADMIPQALTCFWYLSPTMSQIDGCSEAEFISISNTKWHMYFISYLLFCSVLCNSIHFCSFHHFLSLLNHQEKAPNLIWFNLTYSS